MPRNRIVMSHDDFVLAGEQGDLLFFSPKSTPTSATQALNVQLDAEKNNNNKPVITPNRRKRLIVRFGLRDELLVVSNTTLFCMDKFRNSNNDGKLHLYKVDEALHVFDANAEAAKRLGWHDQYLAWSLGKELVISEDCNNALCRNMLKKLLNQFYHSNQIRMLACISACMVLARRRIVNDFDLDEDQLFFSFPLKWLIRFRVAYCNILQSDMEYIKRCSIEKTLPPQQPVGTMMMKKHTNPKLEAMNEWKTQRLIHEEECVICRKTTRASGLYCVCRNCNHVCHLECAERSDNSLKTCPAWCNCPCEIYSFLSKS